MKDLVINLWNWSVDQYIRFKDMLYRFWDFFYRSTHQAPKVASIRDTILYILDTGCSVSRFGDAEMKVLHQDKIRYQETSKELCDALIDVLNKPIPRHITCLIDAFDDVEKYDTHHKSFWKWHLSYYRKTWYKYLLNGRQYYNTHMSRCYMMYKDKSHAREYFDMLKKIWENKNVLLVEGQRSRLGVGNDLFAGCKQVKRILGPQVSAFSKYDDIMKEVLQYPEKEWQIILALGPTATVLAYDLAKKGYQAIDIGNVDTEYEWYKMKALTKVPVPNKYVHEVGAGVGVGECDDEKYQSQIVKVIC